MTHRALVQRLDSYCRTGDAKVRPLSVAFNRAVDAGDQEKQVRVLGDLLSLYRSTNRDLEGLRAPAADRQALRRYTAAQARLVGAYTRLRDAVRSGAVDEQHQLARTMQGVREDRQRAALDLGLRVCGS